MGSRPDEGANVGDRAAELRIESQVDVEKHPGVSTLLHLSSPPSPPRPRLPRNATPNVRRDVSYCFFASSVVNQIGTIRLAILPTEWDGLAVARALMEETIATSTAASDVGVGVGMEASRLQARHGSPF